MNNLIIEQRFDYTGSNFAASTQTIISQAMFNYQVPTGYKALAISGFSTTNTNLAIVKAIHDSATQMAIVRNLTSSQISNATISVYVLFIKN